MPKPSERGSIGMKLLVLVNILLAFGALSLIGAVALVQQAVGTGGKVSTINVTLPGSTTAGNALVCIVYTQTGVTVTSITRTGSTFSQDEHSATNALVDAWSAPNITGTGAVMAVNLSGKGANSVYENCQEWSGIATSSIKDTSGPKAQNSQTALITETITPTSSVERLFVAGEINLTGSSLSSGPDNSFSALTDIGAPTFAASAYRIVGSTSGTYNTTWTRASSTNYDSVIVAYVAATGGGSTLKDPIGRGIIAVPRAYLDRPPTLRDMLQAWFLPHFLLQGLIS